MLALTESARASSIREQVSASLRHGRSALGAQTPDLASARASLAEARGALVIVQLKALARFVEELEDLLTDIDEARAASPAEAIQAMCDCIDALDGFVEALARGDAYQPLSLFPLYAQLCQLRGRPGSEPITDVIWRTHPRAGPSTRPAARSEARGADPTAVRRGG